MTQFNFYPFNHKDICLIDNNKAVLRTETGHLCGYVAIPSDQAPDSWHGNYGADALQYLSIHGGLTYCEVHGGDDDARTEASKLASAEFVRADDETSDDMMDRMKNQRNAGKEARKSVPYTHIVFGFDCAHASDESNFNLLDTNYVMTLVKQMEQQLTIYSERIDEWHDSDRDRKIEIIDEINATVKIKIEVGFGAMIGMLGGATEFDVG